MLATSMRFERKIRDEWYERIKSDLQDCIDARGGWWQNYRASYDVYRNILPVKTRPWKNCANVPSTLTTRACEQLIRRIVMFYVQDDEYVTLSPLSREIAALGRAEKTEAFLRWQAENELSYLSWVDSFVREFVIGGTAFGMTDWAFEERPVADCLVLGRDRLTQVRPGTIPQYVPVGEPVRRRTPTKAILNEVFSSQGIEWGPRYKIAKNGKEITVIEVPYTEQGRKKTARVTIDKREELGDDVQVIAEITRVVKNQPILHFLTAERVLMPPGAYGPRPIQDCELVGIRSWVSWEWIKKNQEKGFLCLDENEMADLEGKFVDQRGWEQEHKSSGYGWSDEMGTQQDQDWYVGVDTQPFRQRNVEIIKVIRKWPILKDKELLPEAQLWILPAHGMLARVHYDSVDNRCGMRNLVMHNFVKARDEAYGISLPEHLRPLQTEHTAHINMRIDRENITGNPVVFIDPTAAFPRDNPAVGPGSYIRVSDPRANVYIPTFGSSNMDAALIDQQLMSMGEDLASGASAPESMGRMSARSTAARTFGGQRLLESNRSFNVIYDARTCAMPITDVWKQVWAWDAAHLPPGKEFSIQGSDEVLAIETRQELRGEYEFRFEAGRAILNDEMKRYLLTEYMQLIGAVSAAMPEQVPKPLWNLCRDLGRMRGIKNPEKYLPSPVEDFGEPLHPHEEHKIWLAGRPAMIHPRDVDMMHLQEHLMFLQGEWVERLPRSVIPHIQQHVKEHYRRMMSRATEGAAAPGARGTALPGNMAMQGNPTVNSAPGAPATTQPEQPQQGLPLRPLQPI